MRSYSSYESWLENCKFLQSQTITELEKSVQLREEMCQLRQKAYCKISGQFDATNFALRKRVFEIHYVLDELMWQKQTVITCITTIGLSLMIVLVFSSLFSDFPHKS